MSLLLASTGWSQNSPTGSWDVVWGGPHQRGVSQLHFRADGTLDGESVFTIHGNRLVHTNGGFIYRHIFGAADVQGGWVQTSPTRITGFLNLIGRDGAATVTNGLSFTGTVRPARLTLLAHGPAGKITLRGVPLSSTPVADLTGTNFLARAQYRRVPFPLNEIFSATPSAPNVYDVTGGGPGYSFTGRLILSQQRQVALVEQRSDEALGSDLAAFAGPFQARTRRGTLKGTDGINLGVRYRFEPSAATPPAR